MPQGSEILQRGMQVVSLRILRSAFVASSVFVAACATPGADLPPLPDAPAGPYRLEAEDQLRITVFEDERLSGEFRVADSGAVAIPLLGPVPVRGLTVSEAESRIRRELQRRQLLQDAGVAVQITTYRPIFVLGMVERGGQFPFQPGMTALAAGLEPPAQRLLFSAWLSENSAEEAAGRHPIAGVDLGSAAENGVYGRAVGGEEIVTLPPDLAAAVRELATRTAPEKP